MKAKIIPSQKELLLIEALREHPEFSERIDQIVGLINDDSVHNVDQVEEKLVELIRQLGKSSMTNWVQQQEKKAAQNLPWGEGKTREREKKR